MVQSESSSSFSLRDFAVPSFFFKSLKKNVTSLVLQREYPYTKKQVMWDEEMDRQLIFARAPCSSIPFVPSDPLPWLSSRELKRRHYKERTTPNWGWIRTKVEKNSSHAQQQVTFHREFIVVKEPGVNTRRFFEPVPFPVDNPFRLKFEILDSDKWRGMDMWTVSSHNPEMVMDKNGNLRPMKISHTLLVLESKKIVLYDYAKGTKLMESDLSLDFGPKHYSDLAADRVDSNLIYVYAQSNMVKEVNPRMVTELLVMKYPPMTALYRIQIPKRGSFSGLDDLTIFRGLLVASKSTTVEIYDFNELMDLNKEASEYLLTDYILPTPLADHGFKTILFQYKTEPLAVFRTLNNIIHIIRGCWPLCVVLRTKQGFELRSIDKPNQVLHSIKDPDNELTVHDVEETMPRIIVQGETQGIEILEIDMNNRIVSNLFSTSNFEFIEQQPRNTTENQGREGNRRRYGLRTNRKTPSYNFDEVEDKFYGCAYEEDLSLFAVCMITQGILYTVLLDYTSVKVFKRLQPVKLAKTSAISELQCQKMEIHFNEWFIFIQLHLLDGKRSGKKFTEVYTVNLIGETIPNESDRVPKKKGKVLNNLH